MAVNDRNTVSRKVTLAGGSRRGFLRGLTSLPLIGGGVALIGSPIAAAVPVTDKLRVRYIDWLATELGEAMIEQAGRQAAPGSSDYVIDRHRQWCMDNRTLNPDPASERFSLLPMSAPSSRAAVILSAAGMPLVG